MSTSLVRAGKAPQTGASSSSAPPPSLLCNLCQKPLATTCFLCACDCIFCEECTYAHFEQSSDCPTCGRVLSEKDFTELVVAEASSTASVDIAKSSLQALFSKQSKSTSSSKALPFSDLCYSLVKQIDVVKQSTKFILKQLLMESSSANRRCLALQRSYENVRSETTQLKQLHSSQRLQLEQANADLQNRLQAREQANAELNQKIKAQEKMLDQFRQLHNGMTISSGDNGVDNENRLSVRGGGSGRAQIIPNSSSGIHGEMRKRCHEPPLKGFIMQKEAQQQQQQAYGRRQPNVLGSRLNSARGGGIILGGGQNQQQQPILARPFSGNSNGSVPNTPRIRDLSSGSGYNFTSSAAQGHHLNKRRRGTPVSNGGMSPNTAFALNQGPHTVGAPRWGQQSSRGSQGGGDCANYHRR